MMQEGFKREYQRLQVAYLTQLKEQAAALERPGTAGAGGFDPAALRATAHKWRGSAGFYGYREIGTLAGALEDWLRAVDDGVEPFSPLELQERLSTLLTAIFAAEPPPEEAAL